ncbi:MAG TPA: type VI secretion system contractile sheath small subunit [Longimicrobium sp.]|jgi:type VI secretion system protein ImpB
MINEMQHWLGSNRPPRVQITYDVETLNSTVQAEIPFVVGIIGDFAGDTTLPAMADRRFTEIDRDNFATVMSGLAPTLSITGIQSRTIQRGGGNGNVAVPDGTGPLTIESLAFTKLDDFGPATVIQNIPQLKALMTQRQQLSTLAARLDTSRTLSTTFFPQVAPLTFAAATTAIAAADAALSTAITLLGTAVDATVAADPDVPTNGLTVATDSTYTSNLNAAKGAIKTWQASPSTGSNAMAASSAIATLQATATTVSNDLSSALVQIHAITDPWQTTPNPPAAQTNAVTATSTAGAAAVAALSAFAELDAYVRSILALNPSDPPAAPQWTFDGATAAINAADGVLTAVVKVFDAAADAAKAAGATGTDALKTTVDGEQGSSSAYGTALTGATSAITAWNGAPTSGAKATDASGKIQALAAAAATVNTAIRAQLTTLHGLTDPWVSNAKTPQQTAAVTAVNAADAAAATVEPAFMALPGYAAGLLTANPSTSA